MQKITSKPFITFVFSDIEHSTRLAQQLREAYPDLLERHRSVIRNAITKHSGKEIDTAGLVEPEDYQSILLSAQVYDDIGSTDLAKTLRERGVAIAKKWLELNPGDTRALYFTANALVFLNQRERSLALLQRALLLEPNDSMLLYNAGCVYALLGMKPEALNCIERSYQVGLTLRGWYENDSNLDSLRDDPRFIRLLAQMHDDPE